VLSAAETRRAVHLLDAPPERRGHWLRWSRWRQQHQATAAACHRARREACFGLPASTSPAPAERTALPTPTAAQWAAILALVERADRAAHRTPLPQRPILEGIVWMMQRSARWQDIPAHFGAYKTIESRYYRWRKRGIWAAILAILLPSPDPAPT